MCLDSEPVLKNSKLCERKKGMDYSDVTKKYCDRIMNHRGDLGEYSYIAVVECDRKYDCGSLF